MQKKLRTLTFSLPFVLGAVFGAATTGIGAGVLGSNIFKDVPRGAFYDEAVGEMAGRGIIRGYEDGKFHPDDYVTRGQVAVLMDRLIQLIETGSVEPPASAPAPEPSPDPEPSSAASSTAVSRSSTSRRSSSSKSSSSKSSSSAQTLGDAGGFQFSKDKFQIGEGSQTIDLVVLRTKGTRGAASVTYHTAPGTAIAGEDYTDKTSRLDFKDGETSKTLSVTVTDDKLGENMESFEIFLDTQTNGTVLLSPNRATISILDNDGGCVGTCTSGSSSNSSANASAAGGTISFAASAYGVYENAGNIAVTVKRTGLTTAAAAVSYTTANISGGAQAGTHYISGNGTLNFAAGETAKTFNVAVVDNQETDGNHSFNVVLSAPTNGAALAPPSSATVAILDNETTAAGSGTLRFSAATYNGLESDRSATITVQRVGGAGSTVSVSYATSSGTASLNDYTPASGTITFAPGETAKSFTVTIAKDSDSEGVETVNLSLTSPVNADFGTPVNAVLNIND